MTAGPLASLARIRAARVQAAPGERCDLCAADLDKDHRHLVDLRTRSLRCACRACALLFEHPGAAGGRYRLVPDRWLRVDSFTFDKPQWENLQIPVGVAFFVRQSSSEDPVAFYPGPAGATESLLPLGAWRELVGEHPALVGVEPDVEAVLIRVEGGRQECYVTPVDACYELVGRLRGSWRGFDGGAEARSEINAFFERAAHRARPAPEATSTARPAPEATSTARPAPEATSTARPAPEGSGRA